MKQVVITNSLLQSLMYKEAALRLIPALRRVRNTVEKARRGCCGRSASTVPLMQQLKQTFIGMPRDRVRQLKQLLGAEELLVYFPSASGPRKVVL